MSSYSEPTELPCAVRSSDGEGLCAVSTCINPALLCASTSDSTFLSTVRDKQGGAQAVFYHRDEAPLPSHSHTRTKAFLAFVQWEPLNMPDFLAYEAPIRPHGTAGGHAILQDPQNRGSVSTNRRWRPTCTDCNRGFSRVQEYKRHLKDVHEPRRQCPFCDFEWTRPNNIKVHLLAKHREKFTAELLVTIQAMRGQMIVSFLDRYNQGYGVEAFASHPELFAWGAL